MDYFEMERRRYSGKNTGGGSALGIGGGISPVVRILIIVNLSVFLLQSLLKLIFHYSITGLFGFVPYYFIHKLYVWQIFTYMFLHGGIFHIFWNLLALWMFGADVERALGSRRFLKYYISCAVFAGLCTLAVEFNSLIPVIGASGAIYGIVVAFGMLFPERVITLLLFFVIPVKAKAKHIAIAFAILTFFQTLLLSGSGIAYTAHLGGILFGYVYFKNFFNLQRFLDAFPNNISFTNSRKKDDNIPSDIYISEEIDPILEKISREGIHTLTKKEKKILKRAKDKLR